MTCKNCGADNKDTSKFCTSCGQELVVEKEKKTTKKKEEDKEEKLTYQQEGSVKPEEKVEEKVEVKQVATTPVNTDTKKTDGKATASLVLGICSIVLFCIMWPLALIGLILGIASKPKSGVKTAGIVINAITLTISTLFLLLVFVGPLFSFNVYSNKDTGKNFFEELEEKMEKMEEELEENEKEIENDYKKDVMKVGSDAFGYVEVPNTWVTFKDVDATTELIQYTDIGEAGYIVTLKAYDEDIEPLTAAQNLYNNIKSEGNTAYYITTYVAGYKGYLVRATYTDGTYLDIYLFKASDNKLHYVAIEGPDRYNDNFSIPKTFTMTK